MQNTSPKADAYIAESGDFARPTLVKLRQLFHQACPQLEETIKWGFPHFEYRGILGSMAPFKQHVSFGFWKGQLMSDPQRLFEGIGKTSMSALRVEKLSDLPADSVLLAYIKEAVELNEKGIKSPRPRARKPRRALAVPDDLVAALARNKKARVTFEGFSYSHRK